MYTDTIKAKGTTIPPTAMIRGKPISQHKQHPSGISFAVTQGETNIPIPQNKTKTTPAPTSNTATNKGKRTNITSKHINEGKQPKSSTSSRNSLLCMPSKHS